MTRARPRKARPIEQPSGGTDAIILDTAPDLQTDASSHPQTTDAAPCSLPAPAPESTLAPKLNPMPPLSVDTKSSPPRVTKIALLQQMLRAPEGVSLSTMEEVTGWQAHTLRAALTRLRQAGHRVERNRSEEGATTYRIAAVDEAHAQDEASSLRDHPAAGADAGASA